MQNVRAAAHVGRLLARGRDEDALAALRRLRAASTDCAALLASWKAEAQAVAPPGDVADTAVGLGGLWRRRETRKALLLSVATMCFQNLSGVQLGEGMGGVIAPRSLDFAQAFDYMGAMAVKDKPLDCCHHS